MSAFGMIAQLRGTPGKRRWLRSTIPAVVLMTIAAASPAMAATLNPARTAVTSRAESPAVEICGEGAAVVKPSSMILTCADNGELAENLHWSSWTKTRATATGIVTWREYSADLTASGRWGSASADVTLTNPVYEPGKVVLFTRLELHVTGPTPHGMLRSLTFDEAPTPASPPATRLPARSTAPRAVPAAASGSLGYAQIEGFWLDAGGPNATQSNGYTDAQIAAAITGAESSFLPGIIQPGVDYCGSGADKAGWGLWQITCGNSVPQYGTDFQLLDPWNNAEAAVYKCVSDMNAGYSCFAPWSTYASGAYANFLQHTSPDTQLTNPGEYVQINSTPPGTPASPAPAPGSTYGPPMPNSTPTAYAFWQSLGPGYDLMQAQGPANGALSGPTDRGMGALGSAPSAGVDAAGNTYVYWRGLGPNYDLWEAYWNGSAWVGPFDRGMGPLGSAPSVAITGNGTAYVFWQSEGPGYNLMEAQGPANGALSGPYNHGMGPLGSAPAAGVDAAGNTYVYWESQGPGYDLMEGYYNGSTWVGPYNRGMGSLGSQPTVAITGNGTAYVFWESLGPGYDLMEAQGPANGALSGPYNHGMGALGSPPAAGVDTAGNTYVYWEGLGPGYDLWEAYYNGSTWVGPYNRGMGSLGSQPTVAVHG